MNHRQAGLANRKDMIELLKDHPINKWLKKWVGRVDKAESDRKKGGYDPVFEEAWSAFGRIGSKPDSALAWSDNVDDPELVIKCIPLYLDECKHDDIPVQHFQRWLKAERWDRYAQIKEKVAQKRACELCHDRPQTRKISYKEDSRSYCAFVCDECRKGIEGVYSDMELGK